MTVKSNALWQVQFYSRELQRARDARKVAKTLPKTLQELKGEISKSYGSGYILDIAGPEAFEVAFDNGVVFEKEYHFTGNYKEHIDIENCTDFKVRGVLRWDGPEIRVSCSSLPKPETCVVEAIEETVTRFKAVCVEEGKEL